MILPIGQLMMAEAAGPKRMGRVMSIVAVPAMLAPILGPTIGGLILDNASWRWIFFVNVPIGIIAVIAALRILPSGQHRDAGPLDVRGLLLMSTGLPLVTYGLAEIGVTGSFTSTKVIVPIVVGLALVTAFAFHALRVPRPLLNLRLYKRATFASASFAMFCLGAALFGGMILLPAVLAGDPPRARPRHRPADRSAGTRDGADHAARRQAHRPLRRRSACSVRASSSPRSRRSRSG